MLLAIDDVISRHLYRTAFVVIRPPGHHTGTRGVPENDAHFEDSTGFCLLNNVGIAAAYAKNKDPRIRICIVDFDVHHGNGTQDIVANLLPRKLKQTISPHNLLHPLHENYLSTRTTPSDTVTTTIEPITQVINQYKPWNDLQSDSDEVLFISTHGYNAPPRAQVLAARENGDGSGGETVWFYPGSGPTHPMIGDLIKNKNVDPHQIIPPPISMNNVNNNEAIDPKHTNQTSFVSIQQQLQHIHDIQQERDLQQINAQCGIVPNSTNHERTRIDVPPSSSSHQPTMFQSNTCDMVDIARLDVFKLAGIGGNGDAMEFDLVKSTNASSKAGAIETQPTAPLQKLKKESLVINAGFGYGDHRQDWRDTWTHVLFPAILAHNPSLILISAGFDGHHRDFINEGYLGLSVVDYEWVTMQLCTVANSCNNINGGGAKIISVLEGGYQLHGGSLISPFAQSVNAHVQVLKTYGGLTTADVSSE